jgi:hypothetical protein
MSFVIRHSEQREESKKIDPSALPQDDGFVPYSLFISVWLLRFNFYDGDVKRRVFFDAVSSWRA